MRPIELHGEIDTRDILKVEAFLPQPTLHIIAEPAAFKERPSTDYEAKFSAQFVVAVCLSKAASVCRPATGGAGRSAVMALALKVQCAADPNRPSRPTSPAASCSP